MLFRNKGKKQTVRIGTIENCHWVTVEKDAVIDLPYLQGEACGFELEEGQAPRTVKGSFGGQEVETKILQPEENLETTDDFEEELIAIKGIGKKAAKEIVAWGKKEDLLKHLEENKGLPFKRGIVAKLKRNYNSTRR